MKVFFSGIFLCIMVLCCPAEAAAGKVYFWTDEDGIRHYSNTGAPLGVVPDQVTEEINEKVTRASQQGSRFDVVKVYDGDTILVQGAGLKLKIRLVGIDAPETGYRGKEGQPFSRKAKTLLSRLTDGKQVFLKSHGLGGYNRVLAEVFHEGTNVNLEMVKAGLAEVYQGKKPKTLDSNPYLQAEKKARNAGTGMWSQGRRYQSPQIWRKEHPRD